MPSWDVILGCHPGVSSWAATLRWHPGVRNPSGNWPWPHAELLRVDPVAAVQCSFFFAGTPKTRQNCHNQAKWAPNRSSQHVRGGGRPGRCRRIPLGHTRPGAQNSGAHPQRSGGKWHRLFRLSKQRFKSGFCPDLIVNHHFSRQRSRSLRGPCTVGSGIEVWCQDIRAPFVRALYGEINTQPPQNFTK